MESIPFAEVKREDRVRKTYEDIPELADSLYEKGFIHPLCINHDSELIAGGRRSAALDHILANPATYPPQLAHSTMRSFVETGMLTFGVHYTQRPTDSIDELSELELVENVQRKNFSWQEQVLAVSKVHKLKVRAFHLGQITDCTFWGQKETGRLLKISAANVNYCLQIGAHLENVDSPMWKLDSLTEALQWLAKQELDKASIKLAESVKLRASQLPDVAPMESAAPATPDGFLTTFDPTNFQTGAGIGVDLDEFGPAPEAPPERSNSTVELVRSLDEEAEGVAHKIVTHMDWLEYQAKRGKNFLDHFVADPPFAIDMKNLKQAGGGGQKDIERIADTHDVEDNLANFEPWLKACYEAVRDKGFVIWFCDAMHFRYLHDLGIKIGFGVQRWPFHWIKTSSCINQRAEKNFTKSIEHAIIFRKGDARLVSSQSTNYWMGGLTPEDKAALPNHPFIKPMALWQHLFKAVALPGSTIGDGFSGVGSSTRAALLGGWMPDVCEIDAVHYSQQIHNIAQAYKQLKK